MRRARLQAVRGAGSLAMQARPAGAHGHQMLRREAERRVRGPVLQGASRDLNDLQMRELVMVFICYVGSLG